MFLTLVADNAFSGYFFRSGRLNDSGEDAIQTLTSSHSF
jgi:hypothetical protein